MGYSRLNHLMCLYIQKDRLDKMHMTNVANDFVSECPDRRLPVFEQFSKYGIYDYQFLKDFK